MAAFTFTPEPHPLPRWLGPFSPSRGTRTGFRFHQGKLGTWVADGLGEYTFWSVVHNQAIQHLTDMVCGRWGGGRVLFLANGSVIKPLQENDEVGKRVLIGRFSGAVVLLSPSGPFDLSRPGALTAGDIWRGPSTTGLECVLKPDGSLDCSWYHPTPYGREEICETIRAADGSLATGFRRARPGDGGGRVRITANGIVLTNRQTSTGTWQARYVGKIDPSTLHSAARWIRTE